jgi:dihydrofolate reductase
MTRFVFYTAATLNGFLADEENSLDWLFVVDQAGSDVVVEFMERVGVFIEGSTTYEWALNHDGILDAPEKWQEFYGDRPTFVFTSRDLPRPEGADVRFVSGPVPPLVDELRALAGEKDVWIVGGGDLVGQFFDAGVLDEIIVSVAPVTLTGGAPLLPRRIESDRLRLVSVEQHGQFAHLTYSVRRAQA